MSAEPADCRFLEIEHKFLVDQDFDPSAFFRKVREFGPESDYETSVEDTYYLVRRLPNYVFRHRCDKFIQQLTLKSLAGDNEARTEVNLDLGHHKGNQGIAAKAFLEPLGILWSGILLKNVQVFYFPDAEVVYYEARFQDRLQKCIEVEVRKPPSMAHAKGVLSSWESALSLDSNRRSRLSILELLVLPSLTAEIRGQLQGMF